MHVCVSVCLLCVSVCLRPCAHTTEARGSLKIRGRKKSPKNRHPGTITQLCHTISSQLRHKSTIGKSLLSSNISSTCPHNMVNFGPLAADIGPVVWGTPANFNCFRILASILQRRRSTEANQTLHDVRPLPGRVEHIHIFGSCCPIMEFCQVQNSVVFSKSCALLLTALLHGTRAVGASQTLRH